MDKYALEVFNMGGEKLLKLAQSEFESFVIVGQDQDRVVLGNSEKNVSFCRIKNKVLERFVFDGNRNLSRKR